MSAAYHPARSGKPYAELTMRTTVGLLILVAHAGMFYVFWGAFLDHRNLERSTTLSFVAQMIDAPGSPLSVDITPPAILKPRLVLAVPVMSTVEIAESLDAAISHFEPAKLDSSRSVPEAVVAQIRARHASSTITLLVEILADGSVGQVEIKASAGAELDATAKSYVRSLHWTPAIVGGKATAMKLLYSLTL